MRSIPLPGIFIVPFDRPNLLEVTVTKMSADESVNNAERLADYWVFGGIFRPVYLEAVPQQFIDYTAIDAQADGSFAMNVFLKNSKGPKNVVTQIVDAGGKIVATANASAKAADSLVVVKTSVKNPLQWTAETPHLYKVNVYLKEEAKNIWNYFLFRCHSTYWY